MIPDVEASMFGPILQKGKTETQRGEFWSQKSWVGTGEITIEEAKLPREEITGGPRKAEFGQAEPNS